MTDVICFDPCRGVRRILEQLCETGVSPEALRLSLQVDDAQLAQWDETQRPEAIV